MGERNIKKLYEEALPFRTGVLKELQSVFESVGVQTSLEEAGDLFPLQTLVTLNQNMGISDEELMGQFCFLPLQVEDNKCHYFNEVFVISEDVTADVFDAVMEVITQLNFVMPIGAFVMDREHDMLAVKYTAVIPGGDIKEAVNYIDSSVGVIYGIINQYITELNELIDGKINIEEFFEKVPETNPEED